MRLTTENTEITEKRTRINSILFFFLRALCVLCGKDKPIPLAQASRLGLAPWFSRPDLIPKMKAASSRAGSGAAMMAPIRT